MQRRGHPWNRRSVITLLLAAALSASAVANPSEKMASKTPSGPKNSAAAGASSWKPTGGRTIAVVGPHPYTGKFRLRVAYDPRTGCKKDGRVWITSEHADYPGAPSFLGLVPLKSWSTKAAAEAAIPHFRAWVDGGRRKQTAAAAAAREASSPRPFVLPERFSKRRAIAGARVNTSVQISTAGVVSVLLAASSVVGGQRLVAYAAMLIGMDTAPSACHMASCELARSSVCAWHLGGVCCESIICAPSDTRAVGENRAQNA